MAIRLSIGASRRHLVNQLLTESVVLSSLGGLAGLMVANWTLKLIAAMMPADDAAMVSFHIDARVLVFMAAVTDRHGASVRTLPCAPQFSSRTW